MLKESKLLKEIESESQEGLIRHVDMLEKGISSSRISTLVKRGILTKVSRGVYRRVGNERFLDPDMEIIFSRVPKAVLCLISALSYHELTTAIPHKVSIALEKNTEPPRIDFPPIEIHMFSGKNFSEGIERVIINGVSARVYCKEKSIADAFKFRNKIGQDIAIEAIKNYMRLRNFDVNKLAKYAKICRVWNVMRPYVEALV